MPVAIDKKLYSKVKALASAKFKSPSGIYRSAWIVKEYKKRSGKYRGTKPKSTGLARWFKEDWVDLKRSRDGRGFHKCGRKNASRGKIPLCRPSKRVSAKTPKTYKELSKKSIAAAKRSKKNHSSIRFKN